MSDNEPSKKSSNWVPKPGGGWVRAKTTIYDELKDIATEQTESESKPEKNKSVLQQNIELLKAQGENGDNLAGWYLQAVKKYPELKEILIVQRPEGKIGAFSRSKFSKKNKSGRHEVFLDLSPDSDTRYMEDFKHRQESLRLIAERLRIPKESLNSRTFQVWILLHELGHALDHIHTNLSGEEKITARSKEMETLPIGKVRIEDLRTLETQEELLQNYPDLFEGLSQKYKSIITDFPGGVVDGWEDVIRLQEREYKSLPSEVYADDFATSIMLSTKFDPNRAA
jgi:hypothetical protein